MYEAFYGLKAKPFSLLPDPAYLFVSKKHQLALSLLQYAVQSQLTLSVLTGEVGTGKTTLIRQLLSELGDEFTIGLISNTHSAFGNVMQWVALAFDLPFKGRDNVELYHDFVEFLCQQYAQGRRTLLIVDEAQNLNAETLEEFRLLANVNADDHLVLQMLLVGQPARAARDFEAPRSAPTRAADQRLPSLGTAGREGHYRLRQASAGCGGGQSRTFSQERIATNLSQQWRRAARDQYAV